MWDFTASARAPSQLYGVDISKLCNPGLHSANAWSCTGAMLKHVLLHGIWMKYLLHPSFTSCLLS